MGVSGYSERTTCKRHILSKMSISGQIVSEILAQLCSDNSIQTLLNFFDPPKKLERVVWVGVERYPCTPLQAEIFV